MRSLSPDVEKMFSVRLSHVWTIIRGLLIVTIVLFLLSVAVTKFEVIVISILVLILSHQFSFQEVFAYGSYEQGLFQTRLLRRVLVALKVDDTYSSELQDEISRCEVILHGRQTQVVIDSVFYYSLWVMIAWKIVSIL